MITAPSPIQTSLPTDVGGFIGSCLKRNSENSGQNLNFRERPNWKGCELSQSVGCSKGAITTRGAIEQKRPIRSEEHTSERQSLMRNSYAVFCLKKKKKRKHITDINK